MSMQQRLGQRHGPELLADEDDPCTPTPEGRSAGAADRLYLAETLVAIERRQTDRTGNHPACGGLTANRVEV